MPHCIKILSLIISKPSPLEQPSVKTFPACGPLKTFPARRPLTTFPACEPLKTFPARRPQDLNSSLRTAALYTGVKTFPVCMAVQCRNSYIGRQNLPPRRSQATSTQHQRMKNLPQNLPQIAQSLDYQFQWLISSLPCRFLRSESSPSTRQSREI